MSTEFVHERVVVRRGHRTGLPVIVAVHSTAAGQAIGGCRIKVYPDWRDGLDDVLRLSAAMTGKCVLAGLPHGGGKTVVAVPPGVSFGRTDLLHDVGDLIGELGGAYATGPDVGTGPDDMAVIADRTPYVFCRPDKSGDSSPHTADGVLAALKAIVEPRGHSFAVLGLGRVGEHVVRLLTEAGARIVAADADLGKQEIAARHGATWLTPDACLTADVDVLVPAALGGLLTPRTVPRLRCRAIAGPANNQLDSPATADLLHERGILWAPDIIVSAGGIINATSAELRHETPERIRARIDGIGTTLASILDAAGRAGTTPDAEARRRVAARC